jgi:hypothetical protein
VLAFDYRGHGQSEYDRNPDNYMLPVALADLSAVLTAFEILPAIFVGTSPSAAYSPRCWRYNGQRPSPVSSSTTLVPSSRIAAFVRSCDVPARH